MNNACGSHSLLVSGGCGGPCKCRRPGQEHCAHCPAFKSPAAAPAPPAAACHAPVPSARPGPELGPVNGGAAGGPAALAGLGAEGSSGCLKQQEAVNLSVLVLAWEAGLYCSILALQGRLQAILPPFPGPPLVLPRLQPGLVAGYRGTGAC